MHITSMDEMRRNVERHFSDLPDGALIADIGSRDYNGSYKPLIVPRWNYIGLDIQPGKNVDILMEEEFVFPIPDNHFDGIISGQCLEHCRNPFRLLAEVARTAKVGARILLTAPSTFTQHRIPVDCWRFMPDGMNELFIQNGLVPIESYVLGFDCWGIGEKQK